MRKKNTGIARRDRRLALVKGCVATISQRVEAVTLGIVSTRVALPRCHHHFQLAGRCDDDILNRGSSSHVHLLIIKSLDERKEKRESVLINYLNNHSYRPRSTPTCPHYLAEENLENFLSLLPPFLPSPRWITRQAPASFFSPLFIALHNFRFLRDK